MNEKTVKIGGLIYTIQECDDPRGSQDQQLLGDLDYESERLRLKRDIPDRVKRATLIHEILHGVLENAGYEHKEPFINAVAHGLCQVLMDNQWIVDLFKAE